MTRRLAQTFSGLRAWGAAGPNWCQDRRPSAYVPSGGWRFLGSKRSPVRGVRQLTDGPRLTTPYPLLIQEGIIYPAPLLREEGTKGW
jgi:hypothetical protein